jgi:hypothetical protein
VKHELVVKVETLGPAKPRADSTVSAPGDTWHPVADKPDFEVNGKGQLRTKVKPEHSDNAPGWTFPLVAAAETLFQRSELSGLYNNILIRLASPEQQAEHRELQLAYGGARDQKTDHWLNEQRRLGQLRAEPPEEAEWGATVAGSPAYQDHQRHLNALATCLRLLDSTTRRTDERLNEKTATYMRLLDSMTDRTDERFNNTGRIETRSEEGDATRV